MRSIDLYKNIEGFLTQFEKMGLYPDFHTISDGVNEPVCTVDGKEYLMFCSNNYLGMTQHPAVKEAGIKAIEKYGMGPGGSRVISGNVDVIEELEAAIADLVGAEDCLTFPTGYMANVTVFTALMGPLFGNYPVSTEDSVIFSDEYNHGSIVDGCRLCKAKKVVFKHDDLEDLEQKIKENDLPNKLIVTEGVFSLDGEITDIPKYIELAKKYGAKLMVDDAHGVGILGEHGGGVGDYHNCAKDIDVIMGCMDKAFGGTGGYLAGNKTLVKYLRIASRSSLLSSSYSTVFAAAMSASTKLIKENNDMRVSLMEKAKYVRDGLKGLGFVITGEDVLPAIPLFVGDDRKAVEFSRKLWDRGIFCIAFRYPAVAMGTSRLRVTVMNLHQQDQLDQLIAACQGVGKELSLI